MEIRIKLTLLNDAHAKLDGYLKKFTITFNVEKTTTNSLSYIPL